MNKEKMKLCGISCLKSGFTNQSCIKELAHRYKKRYLTTVESPFVRKCSSSRDAEKHNILQNNNLIAYLPLIFFRC